MDDLVARAVLIIGSHQSWAAVVLGGIAFIESLAVLGILFPAMPFVIVIGGLIASDVISPIPVFIGSVVGGVSGYIVSYILGRFLGPGILSRWPLNQHSDDVERTRNFFHKYGVASVFLGRFFGPIRCTIPLLAGIMEMDQRRFQLANIASAVAWTPMLLMPGWLMVKSGGYFGYFSEAHWFGLLAGLTIIGVVSSWAVLKLAFKIQS